MFYVAWYNKHFQAQHKAYFPNAQGIYIHRPTIMQHISGCPAVIICSYAPCGNWSTDSRDAVGKDWETAGWSQKTTFFLQSNSTKGLLALSVWLAAGNASYSKQTVFTAVPCILMSSKSFIYQLMHNKVALKEY